MLRKFRDNRGSMFLREVWNDSIISIVASYLIFHLISNDNLVVLAYDFIF